MHEVGIVNGILDTVIRAARGAGASRAVLVTLRIGDMTEVVREALDFAWETFRDEDPLTRGCELAVEEVHPQSECLDCGEVFEHDRFHCRCPQCGGESLWSTDNPERPFCSKRCQLIDLGEWADEQKRIPGEINPDLLPDPEQGDPWQ